MEHRAYFHALVELADDHLILSQRLSECCGHAPLLEEDLAISNLALDLIGAARTLYSHAAMIEGESRTEDELAFLRSEREYRNCLMVEQPNGDFARLMLRQLYFATFMDVYWQAAEQSGDAVVQGIALKSGKEMKYHVRHAGEWVIRLGGGTGESTARLQRAGHDLAPFVEELLYSSAAAAGCRQGLLPCRTSLRQSWDDRLEPVLREAGLAQVAIAPPLGGGRDGRHDECLGHLLAEMQFLQRAFPGAEW